MKLLNVGCGGNRPGEPWTNLDCLREILKPGTPERINLDKEANYVEARIPNDFIHYTAANLEAFDGVLCSHVVEHLTCHEAVALLYDCRRILKPGGLLVVSVPDAEYFLGVYHEDKPENAELLFGEPISADEPWQKSFFDYALFKDDHQMILTSGSLRCLLLKAGFAYNDIFNMDQKVCYYSGRYPTHESMADIQLIMNRRKFSLEMAAIKSA